MRMRSLIVVLRSLHWVRHRIERRSTLRPLRRLRRERGVRLWVESSLI